MGNTVSCCFRANPGDRQEEEQRLQDEGIKRKVAPGKAADSVGNSILPHQKEVAAGLVSEGLADTAKSVASEYADEVTGLREPPASAVVTSLHVNAPAAVDNSMQEVAAGLVSQVLAEATELVEVFNVTLPVDHLFGEASSKMVNTSPTESVQALKDVNLREERCDGDNRDSALPCVPAEKAARAEIR